MDFDLRDIKEFLKDASGYIIAALIVFFTIVYVVSLQMVRGPSMEPNYYSQDILLLNKLYYHLFEPKRFEVVAVEDKNKDLIIKRIIGLPGEKIEYKDNELYINDIKTKEDFTKGSETADFNLSILEYDVIPEDYYLVIGDNRGFSTDSRDPRVGLIAKEDFIGKVSFRLWRVKR